MTQRKRVDNGVATHEIKTHVVKLLATGKTVGCAHVSGFGNKYERIHARLELISEDRRGEIHASRTHFVSTWSSPKKIGHACVVVDPFHEKEWMGSEEIVLIPAERQLKPEEMERMWRTPVVAPERGSDHYPDAF